MGFYHRTPEQVKAALAAAGLRMPSSHYNAAVLQTSLDDTIAFGKTLGLRYILCSLPAIKDPARLKTSRSAPKWKPFTFENYHWNAEVLNQWGRKVKAAGIQFGYHNHTMEVTDLGSPTGFDEMMRLTDPALVPFEMDCGWVTVGGSDPAVLLRKYPERISMLHIKDFKPTKWPPRSPIRRRPPNLARAPSNFGLSSGPLQKPGTSAICSWSRRALIYRPCRRCAWTSSSCSRSRSERARRLG